MSSVQALQNLFIRVKIDEEFRFVTLKKDDADVKSFLTAGFIAKSSKKIEKNLICVGLSTFGIDVDDDLEIEMYDHYNTPISTESFNGIIHQFAHSGSFYVKLKILRGQGSILLPTVCCTIQSVRKHHKLTINRK